jgi:survival-of-motor-neuron-related-splicing factor 30
LAKVYFEKDNKWYHAEIVAIDTDNQEADIQYIGYKDCIKTSSIFVKLMQKPDVSVFIPGFSCEAIYPDDGKYYPCIIEKILEDQKYIVKFKKYNNKETVSLYFLRECKKNQIDPRKKRNFDNLEELKIPENLKYLPNDSAV